MEARGTATVKSMKLAVAMVLLLIAGPSALPCLSGIAWSRDAQLTSAGRALPSTHIVRRLKGMPGSAGIHGLSWSPDGRLFAATMDIAGRQAWIWTADGTLIQKITRGGPYPAYYPLQDAAFVDGDDKILLPPGSGAPGAAMSLYDLRSGALLHDVAGPRPGDREARRNAAATIVPSPDQTLVAVLYATFERKAVGLYSTRSWQRLDSLNDGADLMRNPPVSLAFSPDSRRLAVGRENGSVLLYDVETDRIVREIDAFTKPLHYAPATSVCFSPDGQYVAVGGWEAGSVNIPPPGKTLADNIMTHIVQPYPLQVFRVADGKSVAAVPNETTPIRYVKWSPVGSLIAFIGADNLPKLWDPFGSALPQIVSGLDESADVAFSPDGLTLAVSEQYRVSLVEIDNHR